MKVTTALLIMIFLAITARTQNITSSEMSAVQRLELSKYVGTWYEIYRLPMRAEKDLVNVTATYELRDDGKISVLNQGYKLKPTGKHKKAKAVAWRPNEQFQGELFVKFFGLFKSSYHVLALDDNYKWAIVSTISRKYAWILSRTSIMDFNTEEMLVAHAKKLGIDTSRFIKTQQEW